MSKKDKKDIKIYPETHKRLSKFGNKNETFDDVINRLLDEVEGE